MIGACMRRGVAAGLFAGVLAGLFALAVGSPPLDAAIALEHETGPALFTRGTQKLGLVIGTTLLGAAVGAVFGVAAAWSVGRISGGPWQRSLTLGAAALVAFVALPALASPPSPPGLGDPATIAARTQLYLGACVLGALLVVIAYTSNRALRERVSSPARHAWVGALVLALTALVLAALPSPALEGSLPAALIWRFRAAAIGTQVVLAVGVAVAFAALSTRAPR